MSKSNKTLIFDSVARNARIKKENEEILSQTLKLYQQYGKIENAQIIESIIESLSTIEFFKTNCPEGMKLTDFVANAIKHFQYEQYQHAQPIFHYGEFGDKMYIILKGEVAVFGPRPQDDINKDIELLKEEEEELIIKGQKKQQNIAINLLKLQDQRYYKEGVVLYQKIFQYYSGQCFGDVALTSDKPRSASIIVQSDKAHCISMRRNDFKLIFQKSIQQARNTIEYFMKIFPGALKFNLSKFIQYLRPIQFNTKTILWQIGDEPQFFFIIVTGRVELYKYYDQDSLVGKQNPKKQVSDGLFIGKKPHKFKIVLSQLAEGNIVGQDELLDDLPQRKYYCEVVDNTQAYYMEASDFKAIQGNHPDIIDCLRERSQINQDYINKRKNLIVENFKNYDQYINSLNQDKDQRAKEMQTFQQNSRTKSFNCIRSQKQLKIGQNEILQQHIAFDQKRKQTDQQEQSELKFIINNNNLSAIRERIQRQQQNESEENSPQKHIKNKIVISQILKKYQNKKLLHEKKDKKRKSIFITASQSSIETENSVEMMRQRQGSYILKPNNIRLRCRKISGERSLNNNTTTMVNLTEIDTRTNQITHITPSTCKFFKTIRSISGK